MGYKPAPPSHAPGQGQSRFHKIMSSWLGGAVGGLLDSGEAPKAGSGEGPNAGTGEDTGTLTSKRYSAAHPVLDAIFNGGQGAAAADARNYADEVRHEDQDFRKGLQKDSQSHAETMLMKQVEKEKELANLRAQLERDGYTAKAQTEYDFKRKEVAAGIQDLFIHFKNSGMYKTDEDIYRAIGRNKALALEANSAESDKTLKTAGPAADAINAKNRLNTTFDTQKNDTYVKNPGLIPGQTIAESSTPAIQNQGRVIDNFNALRPMVRVGDSLRRLEPSIEEINVSKLSGDPKLAQFQPQENIGVRYNLSSKGSTPAGVNLNATTVDENGQLVTPFNGRQSSAFEGTGPNKQPPTSTTADPKNTPAPTDTIGKLTSKLSPYGGNENLADMIEQLRKAAPTLSKLLNQNPNQ